MFKIKKKIRNNSFNYPLNSYQIIIWFIFLYLICYNYYYIIIIFQRYIFIYYIIIILQSILVLFIIITGFYTCVCNPIDPILLEEQIEISNSDIYCYICENYV